MADEKGRHHRRPNGAGKTTFAREFLPNEAGLPVFVGDLVSFWTETLRIGTTSITTKVTVEAIRTGNQNKRVTVTEAQVVYVNLGEDRKPKPI